MKSPSPWQRRLILGSLLLGTVAAAYFVEDEAAAPVESKRRARKDAGTRPQASENLDQSPLSTETGLASTVVEEAPAGIDPFRSTSWYVAPPPPPPPKPTAPPLPFTFLGQLIEEDGTRVFVNHQGRHLIIKAGDVIAGTYAVEEIAAGKVVFLYLPLKERQVLATGAG